MEASRDSGSRGSGIGGDGRWRRRVHGCYRSTHRRWRLARLRSNARQHAALAAHGDHAGERRAARPRVHGSTLKKIDPTIKIGEQSYPVAVDGQLYVTTNDDNVFRIDGATGQDRLAVQAGRHRRLQELRHRREPRRRLLRRQALPAHARHAHERAEPGRRAPDQARHDRAATCPAPARTTATPRRARRSAPTIA